MKGLRDENIRELQCGLLRLKDLFEKLNCFRRFSRRKMQNVTKTGLADIKLVPEIQILGSS